MVADPVISLNPNSSRRIENFRSMRPYGMAQSSMKNYQDSPRRLVSCSSNQAAGMRFEVGMETIG